MELVGGRSRGARRRGSIYFSKFLESWNRDEIQRSTGVIWSSEGHISIELKSEGYLVSKLLMIVVEQSML